MSADFADDAAGGVAVAVGIYGFGHFLVSDRVGEQGADFGDNFFGIGADELDGAGVDAFGAFGGVAHHEHGLAETGGFFLDAAGIGEHDAAGIHQGDEVAIVLGRDEPDVVVVAELLVDRSLDVGVEVHRIDEAVIREATGEGAQRGADLIEAAAEVFAAVAGDQHVGMRLPIVAEQRAEMILNGGLDVGLLLALDFHMQGVDYGVAGDDDAGVVDTFVEQVLSTEGCGWEGEGHDAAGEFAIGFFGVGRPDVPGAQACFDVIQFTDLSMVILQLMKKIARSSRTAILST